MTMLSTRFSSFAVKRPHRTSALPKHVTADIPHTAALSRGFPRRWDNDDTPAMLLLRRYIAILFMKESRTWSGLWTALRNIVTEGSLNFFPSIYICSTNKIPNRTRKRREEIMKKKSLYLTIAGWSTLLHFRCVSRAVVKLLEVSRKREILKILILRRNQKGRKHNFDGVRLYSHEIQLRKDIKDIFLNIVHIDFLDIAWTIKQWDFFSVSQLNGVRFFFSRLTVTANFGADRILQPGSLQWDCDRSSWKSRRKRSVRIYKGYVYKGTM